MSELDAPQSPSRARPIRRRRHEPARAHERRGFERATPHHPAPRTEGSGGSFGGGPVDDDGDGGRRPERGPNDQRKLLVVLGLLVIGAGVMSARLLTSASRRPPGT